MKSIPGPALIDLGGFPSLEFATFSGAQVPGAILQEIATLKPRLDIEADRVDEIAEADLPPPPPDVPSGPD